MLILLVTLANLYNATSASRRVFAQHSRVPIRFDTAKQFPRSSGTCGGPAPRRTRHGKNSKRLVGKRYQAKSFVERMFGTALALFVSVITGVVHGASFRNLQTCSIEVFAWTDKNNNDSVNPVDALNDDVKVRLSGGGFEEIKVISAGTNPKQRPGVYFDGLDCTRTYKAEFDFDGQLASKGYSPLIGNGVIGSITTGTRISMRFQAPGSAEVFVWDDRNRDKGFRNGNEPGVEGIRLILTQSDRTAVHFPGTTTPVEGTSNSNGIAELAFLPAETNLRICVVDNELPVGVAFTDVSTVSPLDSNRDSEIPNHRRDGLSCSNLFRKTSETTSIKSLGVGLLTSGSAEVFVFEDRVADEGEQNGNRDPGYEGVHFKLLFVNNVEVLDPQDNPVTATSDSTGIARIPFVPAAQRVKLCISELEEYIVLTTQAFGGNDDRDSDFGWNLCSETFETTLGGEVIRSVDVGLILPGKLTVTIFDDEDNLGKFNSGRSGEKGIDASDVGIGNKLFTVQLLEDYDAFRLGPQQSGVEANGDFEQVILDGVSPRTNKGSQILRNANGVFRNGIKAGFNVTIPKGFRFPNRGPADKDAVFTVTPGVQLSGKHLTAEIPVFSPGSLLVKVIDDRENLCSDNTGGSRDAFVGGVKVSLTSEGDPVVYPDWHAKTGALTDEVGSDGKITFDYVGADTRTDVQFELPQGFDFSNGCGQTVDRIMPSSGGQAHERTLFVWAPGTAEICFYSDKNGDGSPNPQQGEGPVENVDVMVLSHGEEPIKTPCWFGGLPTTQCSDAERRELGADEEVSATSGSTGCVSLAYVPANAPFFFKYDLPEGFRFSRENRNEDANFISSISENPDGLNQSPRAELSHGSERLSKQVGVVLPGTISIKFYNDSSRNTQGSFNPQQGENGLAGMSAELLYHDGTPVMYPEWFESEFGPVKARSDSSGFAKLPYVPADKDYYVQVTAFEDFIFGSSEGEDNDLSRVFFPSKAQARTQTFRYINFDSEHHELLHVPVVSPGAAYVEFYSDKEENAKVQPGKGEGHVEGIEVKLLFHGKDTPVATPLALEDNDDVLEQLNNGNEGSGLIVPGSDVAGVSGLDGLAQINYIPAGERVYFKFTLPEGFRLSRPVNDDFNFAYDGSDRSPFFSVDSIGGEFLHKSVGIILPGTIELFFFSDVEANGQHNPNKGEGPVEGMTAMLLNSSFDPITYPSWWSNPDLVGTPVTASSNDEGIAILDYVPADVNHRVILGKPDDFAFGPVATDDRPNGLWRVTGRGGETVLFRDTETPSELKRTLQIPIFLPGSVKAEAWNERGGSLSQYNVQRGDEYLTNDIIGGCTVVYGLETNGEVIHYPSWHPKSGQSVVETIKDGFASIYVPADRKSRVRFELRDGTALVEHESLVNHRTGMSNTFEPTESEQVHFAKAAYKLPGTAKLQVFVDENGNGRFTDGEPPTFEDKFVYLTSRSRDRLRYPNSHYKAGSVIRSKIDASGSAWIDFIPTDEEVRIELDVDLATHGLNFDDVRVKFPNFDGPIQNHNNGNQCITAPFSSDGKELKIEFLLQQAPKEAEDVEP